MGVNRLYKTIIMAIFMFCSGPLFSYAQSSPKYIDPYADEIKQQTLNDYHARKNAFLTDITEMYFAVGCGVFPSDTSILPLMQAEGRSVEIGGPPVIDMHGQQDMRIAATAGLEKAKRAGECNYWKQNPEALYAIRQRAQNAFP